ncbi:MAG TPA: hypothetical protein VEI82_15150 [Myxococcota bacterium]|nr:hypothetical protein [Myxococcota bacterium]
MVCAALLGAVLLADARPASASDEFNHPAMSYVGATMASLMYFPAKVAFAVGGAVASGVAYAVTLGDPEPSHEIWAGSVEGDYVVTPDMIEGRRPVEFVGR